jgi:tetratricopeptide (TPR) repeat protein
VTESPTIEVASIRPEEADEQLRSARDADNIEEAIRIYNNLVSSSLHLDRVIDDMQQLIKSYPSNPILYQIMGDAMLRDGRLQSALEIYRQALLKL